MSVLKPPPGCASLSIPNDADITVRFCSEIAPLLNFIADADRSHADRAIVYSVDGTRSLVIIKGLFVPEFGAVNVGLDPRFCMSLTYRSVVDLWRGDIDPDTTLYFYLEWADFGIGVQFGVWRTTVAEFDDFSKKGYIRNYNQRCLFDVRHFSQVTWELDTRGKYFQERPYSKKVERV